MKTTPWMITALALALALVACDDSKKSPETKTPDAPAKQDTAKVDAKEPASKDAKPATEADAKVEAAAENGKVDKALLEGKKSKLGETKVVSHELAEPAPVASVESSSITVTVGDEEPRTFTFIDESAWNWSYEPGNFILTYMSMEDPEVGEIFGLRIHVRSKDERVQLGKELSNSAAALSLTIKRSDELGMDDYESTLGEMWYELDPKTGKLSASFETETRHQPTYKPPLVDDKNLFKKVVLKGSFTLAPKAP